MKKYLVLRTNHGFKGRMWRQDQVVEFEDDVVPPRHFQLLDGRPEVKKIIEEREEEKTALSKLARKSIKPQPTAGQTLGSQKRVGEKIQEPKKPGEDF